MGIIIHDDLRQRWVKHKCTVKGCAERMVTIDGLMKVRQPKCAAKGDRIRMSGELPNVVQCCPLSPLRGNQHKGGSKYCEHNAMKEDRDPLVVRLVHLSKVEKSHLGEVPANDMSWVVACKKPGKVDKVFDTTAGILAAVRPRGIIVNFMEMFTCESASQAYLFMMWTFGESVEALEELRYVAYDRACDLQPFLMSMERKGSVGAKILLEHCKFFVDRFHVKGHTTPCCSSNIGVGKFHPDLPAFAEVKGANTECAEQVFSQLGQFKRVARQISMHKLCVFMAVMIKQHNSRIESSRKN